MLERKPILELLAPAGDEAALRAAVCAGADAVYLGYVAFSARATAANFDGEQLAKAVAYAHLYGVRVYVTVNTLVKEAELPAAYQALQTIAAARADGVIAQDLAVVALARAYFPTLEIHASTQMALHNATGVRWAKSQGIARVVLARECTLPEIALAAQEGVAIEVFVHGALCSGVSGQCLMSSMAGGRSGNRGRCAQPCRQSLQMGERSGALLSLRDLCLRDHLPQLLEAGVHSLKIEGRLKRPEYVAVVVDSYRRAVDALLAGKPAGWDKRPAATACPPRESGLCEKEWLMQAFHRGGFTAGFAGGAQDGAMADPGWVGHGGLPMGRVESFSHGLASVRLTRELHDGDGLQLRGQDSFELRYSGKDKAAGETALLRLRPGQTASVGEEVARLTDVRQMEAAQRLCQEPALPIGMKATLALGQPMSLTLRHGEVSITCSGETPQQAKTRSATPQEVYRCLTKLGDSPFCLAQEGDLALEMEDGLFVPVSSLNALRRQAVEALQQARTAVFFGREKEQWLEEHAFAPWEELPEAAKGLGQGGTQAASRASQTVSQEAQASRPSSQAAQTLAVSFRDPALAPALQEAGATLLLFAPFDWRPEALSQALAALPPHVWLELPPFLSEAALQDVMQTIRPLEKTGPGLAGVVLGSVGQLGADFGLPVALGCGVPATNHLALQAFMQSHPGFYTLWPEWSFGELLEMSAAWQAAEPGAGEPQSAIALLSVYGRQPLMLLRHCPHRTALGLATGREACALCQGPDMACGRPQAEMTDRKGYRFPLTRTVTREGCVVNVLNALPTDLRKQENKRRALGAGMLLRFTTGSAQEQLALTKAFAALLRGESIPANPSPTTGGHLLRGVE